MAEPGPTDVIVFIHAPTRARALELVDRFAKAIGESGDVSESFRFVASSDDSGEGHFTDDRKVAGQGPAVH